MQIHSFQIHLDHMMDKVDAFTGHIAFLNRDFTQRLHCCYMAMRNLKSTAKEIDGILAREISQHCGKGVAIALRLGRNSDYKPDNKPFWNSWK